MTAIWIALGLGAWTAATFVPPYLSVLFQRKAKLVQAPWLVHLAFAPTVLAITWCSAFLLTLADGDQDRAPDARGLGILLLPAMLILLTTLLFYYGKLAVRVVKRVSASRANGS